MVTTSAVRVQGQKHLTVGVAGHVDHGKTALVRAVTGTETDRLKEEQQRGMSIVLGFAHLALPDGEADLIDVPGHEKFIRTMISGATGLDAALLTVAANERVKPQTVEHLALLGLLGVRRGLVAITKSDLAVGGEERERVNAEVREFLGETFLRDARIVWTSAVTGEGLEEIRQAISTLLLASLPPPTHSYFYLPVDRVFTMTGYGTVVTGTLRRGTLTPGQSVELWPRGGRAEVRGLEVHGQPVEIAFPGWRTAVNLRGVKKSDLGRGDALATPGVLRPTRLLDVRLTLLASAGSPLRRGQTALLYHGTAEISARVYPLGQDSVNPGETTHAQLRLAEDTVVPAGEPFILRRPSPLETLGGGIVLDPYPQKHMRSDSDVLGRVQTLANGSPAEKLTVKLWEAGSAGCDLRQTALDLGLLDDPMTPGVSCGIGLTLHPDIFVALGTQARDAVRRFHAAHPLRRGMRVEELRRSLPRTLPSVAYHHLLRTLADAGGLESANGLIREAAYSPEAALSPVQRRIAAEIEAQFRDGGLKPPGLEEVTRNDRRRGMLAQVLMENGAVVPVTERASGRTVIFHRDVLADAVQALHEVLQAGEGRSVSELNAVLGTTRKFSIPLLEYFDETGITRREGDLRFWNHEKEIAGKEHGE